MEVSRGFGPNKKSAKTAAAQILLQLMCPKIYKEWAQNKQKTIPDFNMQPESENQKIKRQNKADLEMQDEFNKKGQTQN